MVKRLSRVNMTGQRNVSFQQLAVGRALYNEIAAPLQRAIATYLGIQAPIYLGIGDRFLASKFVVASCQAFQAW